MYTIFKKQQRNSINVPFYFEKYPTSNEYKLYFQSNFVSTGKFISYEVNYADDRLTITDKLVWSSRDAFLEYAADAFCYVTVGLPNRLYNVENNISTEILVERTFVCQ